MDAAAGRTRDQYLHRLASAQRLRHNRHHTHGVRRAAARRIYVQLHPRTPHHALARKRGAGSGQGAFRPGHRPVACRPVRLHARRLRDPNTTDDLTQETLLRLLAYRDAPDIGDYALLMYRIAHNVVLEHWRTRHRRHANAHVALDLIAPLAADGAHVDQIADARRILQHLHTHTLPALPPRCRQAFILNRIDGLTYPQVAAAMGISIKMVEKHISRALAACRAAVQ
ncbi:RNA polymerase sigma factor [Xanthomonas arboricola]|uniref:RNA polymerase sigma factor n=1 Tax=Xanthomonas arboricola TaxID=56448 RepID=UPI002157A2DA|nr:RNA polymerase sigma factor [Xanthomonas arboricola]